MSPTAKQVPIFRRLKLTLEIKREIIKMREQGLSVADISARYNRSASTICTILKNKEKIMESEASKGMSRISPQHPPILDDVERLLLIWINQQQLKGDTINESIICHKAKMIFSDLKMASTSTVKEDFKASRGWFQKFKSRTGIYNVAKQGEDGSSDTNEADIYLDSQEYLPQQVPNFAETGLFWNKMPELCANACGDLNIKEEKQEEDEEPSSSSIQEILTAWELVQSFVEKHHPDKALTMYATHDFDDNVLSYFKNILNGRQE